jgi:hypothetical protein
MPYELRNTNIYLVRCARVYIVSFRTHDDRRPSKFIVLADNMRSAINEAWEHGGADFQSRFDKSTAQAIEMKKGALRVLCNMGNFCSVFLILLVAALLWIVIKFFYY